jgi:hypothetical protein
MIFKTIKNKNMRSIIRRKPYLIPLFIIIGAAALALFGWIVMALWNAVLVPATGAGVITFWQALGILVLSRILVGGFGGGSRSRRREWYWKKKWMNMTTEEKARFREEWKQCYGKDFFDEQKDQTSPESQQ